MAILYFRHYELGDQTYPYYPEPATSVSSLPGETGGFQHCLLGICWDFTSSYTLSQSTFPIYIHERYGQAQVGGSGDEPAQVLELEASIQQGVPVLLLLGLGTPEGHAVVAWGYSELSSGGLVIGISDPNFGNVPTYAYYSSGQFSYTGIEGSSSYTWTTFSVLSPQVLQWAWLAPNQLNSTVELNNPYYTFVFSSVPITIQGIEPASATTSTSEVTGSTGTTVTSASTSATGPGIVYLGQASFGTPEDSQSFNSTIPGVVGFEEGGIQVYGIPLNLPFTVKDPGGTSSRIEVIIPQNSTSVVGYQLNSASSTPLSLNIVQSHDGLNVTTSNDISLSVAFFSAGERGYSVFDATAIPVGPSQTAAISVPDWSALNNPQSPPTVELYSPSSNQAVTTFALTTGVQTITTASSQSSPAGLTSSVLPLAVITAVVVVAVALAVVQRKGVRHTSDDPIGSASTSAR